MGLFYPGMPMSLAIYSPLTSSRDNPKRMARVQQLVDSISNLQADLKNVGKQMDDQNKKYRPAINALLKAHGVASVDEVINDAASKMTANERKVFEAVSLCARCYGGDVHRTLTCSGYFDIFAAHQDDPEHQDR